MLFFYKSWRAFVGATSVANDVEFATEVAPTVYYQKLSETGNNIRVYLRGAVKRQAD
jgi:hypothetical protein